jgi:hypothetical protein
MMIFLYDDPSLHACAAGASYTRSGGGRVLGVLSLFFRRRQSHHRQKSQVTIVKKKDHQHTSSASCDACYIAARAAT